MLTRRDAAIRLDIPVEMAARHGIGASVAEGDVDALLADPPAWLVQSRANRPAGARPVWVRLECVVCGLTEFERPKKWWPELTAVVCDRHDPAEAPRPGPGLVRAEIDGIGSRFVGLVDAAA